MTVGTLKGARQASRAELAQMQHEAAAESRALLYGDAPGRERPWEGIMQHRPAAPPEAGPSTTPAAATDASSTIDTLVHQARRYVPLPTVTYRYLPLPTVAGSLVHQARRITATTHVTLLACSHAHAHAHAHVDLHGAAMRRPRTRWLPLCAGKAERSSGDHGGRPHGGQTGGLDTWSRPCRTRSRPRRTRAGSRGHRYVPLPTVTYRYLPLQVLADKWRPRRCLGVAPGAPIGEVRERHLQIASRSPRDRAWRSMHSQLTARAARAFTGAQAVPRGCLEAQPGEGESQAGAASVRRRGECVQLHRVRALRAAAARRPLIAHPPS